VPYPFLFVSFFELLFMIDAVPAQPFGRQTSSKSAVLTQGALASEFPFARSNLGSFGHSEKEGS
jgi:hypothetical protein